MSEFIEAKEELNLRLAQSERKPVVWSNPTEFDLANKDARDELNNRFRVGEIKSVFDPLTNIANDLYEYENPDKKDDEARKEAFVGDIVRQGSEYGSWFLFPWSGELVRYPSVEEHRALRTSRNRDLITKDEQRTLYNSTLAVFGLSVGSKVVESLVESGIGGKIVIGDPDSIDPSNLNRLRGGLPSVGRKKVDHAAIQISELDPYIEQIHFKDGVTRQNLQILEAIGPDIVFDEVDDLSMKATLRKFGEKTHTPIVMATDLGDRSLIDVERYDQEQPKLFNGRLKPLEVDLLSNGAMSAEESRKLTAKIVGMRHVTTRMIESVMQIGETLPGMPQLGTTAAIGGAHAAIVAREIILGRQMSSGRYVSSPKKNLNLEPQASALQGLKTALKFVRSTRNS
jgi:hypothetical protein